MSNRLKFIIMVTFFQFRVLETFFSEKSWKKKFRFFPLVSQRKKFIIMDTFFQFRAIETFFLKIAKKIFFRFFFPKIINSSQIGSNSSYMDTFFQFRGIQTFFSENRWKKYSIENWLTYQTWCFAFGFLTNDLIHLLSWVFIE